MNVTPKMLFSACVVATCILLGGTVCLVAWVTGGAI